MEVCRRLSTRHLDLDSHLIILGPRVLVQRRRVRDDQLPSLNLRRGRLRVQSGMEGSVDQRGEGETRFRGVRVAYWQGGLGAAEDEKPHLASAS